jgi:hypothetical protein
MHFYGIVLLEDQGNVKQDIANMMDKFDEGREVEPYQVKCWGCEETARKKAESATEKELGTSWKEIHKAYDKQGYFGNGKRKKNAKTWEEFREPFYTKYNENVEKFVAKHRPLKSCKVCDGTGKETVTYNPDGKFDWYRVGGRWDGEIQDRDYVDLGTEDHYSEAHEKIKNNILSVKRLIEKKEIPYSLIVDNQWHDRYEKPDADWNKQVMALYKSHPTYVAVGIDYHS